MLVWVCVLATSCSSTQIEFFAEIMPGVVGDLERSLYTVISS